MTTTTPDMSLVLPDVSVTVGPTYATLLNAALTRIDLHDHSTGLGIKITPSGLNISSDLTFASNNATNLRTARLFNNSSISLGVNDKTCLYSLNNELYYVDGAGNNVQVTASGSINIGSTSSLTLNDTAFILQYFGDSSRKFKFSAANVPVSTTRTYTLADSGANDTIPTNNSTSVLTNKVLSDTTTSFGEVSDNSKALKISLTSATTAKTMTVSSAHTNNRTVTLPDATDTLVGKATTDNLTNKSFTSVTVMKTANVLRFNNSADTFYTGLSAGANAANVTFALPITDGSASQVMKTDGSGQLGWTTAATTTGNVAANDSAVTFTNADNRHQSCLPTAARTYTLPTTSISAGDTWDFDNKSAFLITVNSSGGNLVGYVYPLTSSRFVALITTPTTAANWSVIYESSSIWTAYTPAFVGFGTVSNASGFYKVVGDSLFVKGSCTGGTSTAVIASISLPTWATISSAKLSLANTTSNPGNIIGMYGNNNTGSVSCYVLSATGTSTSLVYIGKPYGTAVSPIIPTNGNNISDGNIISFQFEVPLV